MSSVKQKTNNTAAHERLSEHANKAVQHATKAAANEAGESGKTFLRQLLGLEIGGGSKAKDAKDNHVEAKQPEKRVTSSGLEIIDLIVFNPPAEGEKKKSAEKAPRIEAAMNHGAEVAQSGERASRAEVHQMNQNVQEIKAELQKLMASSKVLQMEFAEVDMEQAPVEAGTYHVNFFDWMLIVIRQARQKVEDSGAWLSAVQGKRKGKAKTDYSVANQKMHQSGERTTVQNAVG